MLAATRNLAKLRLFGLRMGELFVQPLVRTWESDVTVLSSVQPDVQTLSRFDSRDILDGELRAERLWHNLEYTKCALSTDIVTQCKKWSGIDLQTVSRFRRSRHSSPITPAIRKKPLAIPALWVFKNLRYVWLEYHQAKGHRTSSPRTLLEG